MTLEDHSECPIPRDEVESILDDEIEKKDELLLFTRNSDDPPSYSIYQTHYRSSDTEITRQMHQ